MSRQLRRSSYVQICIDKFLLAPRCEKENNHWYYQLPRLNETARKHLLCLCVSNTIALRAVWFLSTRFLLHFFLVASQLAGNNVTDNEFKHMDRDMLISSTLRPMQTDATLLANNTQHCWAQHVASDCMEPQQCWHLLHKV